MNYFAHIQLTFDPKWVWGRFNRTFIIRNSSITFAHSFTSIWIRIIKRAPKIILKPICNNRHIFFPIYPFKRNEITVFTLRCYEFIKMQFAINIQKVHPTSILFMANSIFLISRGLFGIFVHVNVIERIRCSTYCQRFIKCGFRSKCQIIAFDITFYWRCIIERIPRY